MFTKLFKKSHDPYELGGRWYKFSSDDLHASNPTFVCDDVFDPAGFTVSGSNLFFTINKPNLKPIVVMFIRDFAEGSTQTSGLTQGYATVFKYLDGRTAIQATQIPSTGHIEVYVYCI